MNAATSSAILPSEPGFFSTPAAFGSLSAAAREIGITTSAVSKRRAQIEHRLGSDIDSRHG